MATAPPTINALPSPPDPNDRSTFNTRAYPWSVAQQTLATEANAVAANVFNNATEAATSANSAATSVLDAIAQVTLANAAASSAEATVGATQWASGATYAIGDCVWSPLNQQTYRRKVAGAGTTDPSDDNTNWAQVGGGSPKILRSTRTSNVQLTTADNGKLIDITSGTFTQTFGAAETLGDGWFCYLRNSGNGDITLDPNAAELIDGLTSYVMYPGEFRLVQCDGVALRTVVLNAFYRVFTASGTFTKPPGYVAVNGLLWSAGASGGKRADTSSRGGPGGGCFPFTVMQTQLPSSVSVVIGAGGTSVVNNYDAGIDGGNSSFGSLLTVYGGGALFGTGSGRGGSVSVSGFVNGTYGPAGFEAGEQGASGGRAIYGGGAAGEQAHATRPATGGLSLYGGGGGGSFTQGGLNAAGGVSTFGGSGGNSGVADNGQPGAIPGGGGGATQTGAQSGAGARGELRLWGII